VNVVAVIQARMASTRLPGKVMLPLNGRPLLQRLVERVSAATQLDDVVVATTANPEDEPIRRLCAEIGMPVFSGHPTDLLDRHYHAGLQRGADAVAKIPSDCPLIDPAIIDHVVGRARANPDAHFVSNLHPPTHPDGNDVEVIPMPVLEIAWKEAVRDFEREHTTPFIWDRPERFRVINVRWTGGRDYSMVHRFTIDYPEDYAFIAAVYRELHVDGGPPFSLDDILNLLERRDDIFRLNSHFAGVNWYRKHLRELRTIGVHQTVALETA
jgi:spore coat polysaccharide biosynthesis protein SpsF